MSVLDYFDRSALDDLRGKTIAAITHEGIESDEHGYIGVLTITTTDGQVVRFETRDDYSKLSWLVVAPTVQAP